MNSQFNLFFRHNTQINHVPSSDQQLVSLSLFGNMMHVSSHMILTISSQLNSFYFYHNTINIIICSTGRELDSVSLSVWCMIHIPHHTILTTISKFIPVFIITQTISPSGSINNQQHVSCLCLNDCFLSYDSKNIINSFLLSCTTQIMSSHSINSS